MSQVVPRATFRKHERLTGALRIQAIATAGLSVSVPPFKLLGKLMPLKSSAPAQIAFAVPKRNLPLAVERNRMRRLMREAYRSQKRTLHERLRERGVQCAWLLVFQGKRVIGHATATEKISQVLSRWFHEHLDRDH